MKESKHRFPFFVAYLIIFHTAWLGYVLWVYPRVRTLGETTLRYALVNITVRLILWVLPVFLYLRYIDRVNPFEYLKLRQNWRQGIVVGVLVSTVIFIGNFLRSGMPHPSIQLFTWNSLLSTSLLIGFIEEVPYRGFILQKIEQRCGFWAGNLLSSLLFLGIHLPGWISLHLLKPENAIFVFLFGVVMAIVVKVGKSLWGTIIAHSMNDFISSVIYRF